MDNKNTGSSNAPQDETPIFPDVVPNMDNKNTGSSNAPEDETPIFPDVVPNMADNDDPRSRSQQSLGDGQGADVQPLSDLEEGFDYFLISELEQLVSDVDFTSQPEAPVLANSSNYNQNSASDMKGSAAHQIEESSSQTREFASSMKGSAAYQMEDPSLNRKRKAVEVPLTIREPTPAAYPQQFPVVPAVQVNPRRGIPNLLYDPMYEQMGYPVDPILRRFAELEKQNKGKKDK